MPYSFVRVAGDYTAVILAYAADSEPSPDNPANEYFEYNIRTLEDRSERERQADEGNPFAVFTKISRAAAFGYISGIADGLGFGDKPREDLPDMPAIWRWVRYKQKEYLQLERELYGEEPLNFYTPFPDDTPEPHEPRYLLEYADPGARRPWRKHLPVENDEQARGAFAVVGHILVAEQVRDVIGVRPRLWRVMNDGTSTEIE